MATLTLLCFVSDTCSASDAKSASFILNCRSSCTVRSQYMEGTTNTQVLTYVRVEYGVIIRN